MQRDSSQEKVTIDEVVARLASETDAYELQRLLSQGLELADSAEEIDRVLLEAGTRLGDVTITEAGPRRLDRLWLRTLGSEAAQRASGIDDRLVATAQAVLRSAVYEAQPEIDAWAGALAVGESGLDFLRRAPKEAASLRELSRIAHRLRRIGAADLVAPTSLEILERFRAALDEISGVPPGAIPDWMRVSRQDLLGWARDGDAVRRLPALVRRLVRETGDRVTELRFPDDSAVTSGGWDGQAEAGASTIFVPSGRSAWELSKKANSLSKATSDFAKRAAHTSLDEQRSTIYIQVLCQPWTKRDEFVAAAKAASEFRDVRGYNVDDLVAWLEQAPSTTVWMRELLERPLAGLLSIDARWRSWLESTTPELDETILLAGRRIQTEEVRARTESGRGVTTIGGDVRYEEIEAFVGAVAADDPNALIAGTVVIDDKDAARRMMASDAGAVLFVGSPEMVETLPPASPHHVLVAVAGGERVDIAIPRLDGSVVTNYFRALGRDLWEADDLGELARRSLLALRRSLAKQPERHRPAWAEQAKAIVRRTALLEVWDRSRARDVAAVTDFIGRSHVDVEEQLHLLSRAADDPFVARFDNRWHVVSPTDAWLLLSGQFAPDDLDRFVDIGVDVLTDVDPVTRLLEEEGWRALHSDVERSYSSHLRRGIARSVAMLGALGLTANYTGGQTGPEIARGIAWRVVDRANADPSFETWTAVSPHLSLLAEASPTTVIDGLRAGLAADPPLMHLMFRDGDESPFGSSQSSPHLGVLRALETLAWAPEHFADAIDILADLALLDPGGRYSNRPLSSIKTILTPWRPDTTASVEQRIRTVDRLRRSHPDLSWGVVRSLLPGDRGARIVTRGPELRDWKRSEVIPTAGEVAQVVEWAAQTMIEDAGVEVDRWVNIIEAMHRMPPALRGELEAGLRRLASELVSDDRRQEVWSALRAMMARHRQHPNARWSLPATVIDALDPIAELFAPKESDEQHRWLFDDPYPDLGSDLIRRDDVDLYEAELRRRRADAVALMLNDIGLNGVLEFAATTSYPGLVGVALADGTVDDELDPSLFEALGEVRDTRADAAFAYFRMRMRDRGWEYVTALVRAELPLASARLLRAIDDPIEASKRAAQLGEEVAAEFWREVTYFGLGRDYAGAMDLAAGLRNAGRFAASLHLLALYARTNDTVEFAEAFASSLEGLMAHGDDPETAALDEHDFETALKTIARHAAELGPERAARIEWHYLPVLGFRPDARILHRALADDPAFFAEVVALIYRSSDEEESTSSSPERASAAENAYRLLNGWRTVPGSSDDGEINGEALDRWITEARRLLDASGHTRPGDSEIGQVLAASVERSGELPDAVKSAIQIARSEQIDRGFESQVFNDRGVHSRSLDTGGKPEWDLVTKYRSVAEANRVDWPRVAKIFDRLADSYEQHAQREDREAERRRRGLE